MSARGWAVALVLWTLLLLAAFRFDANVHTWVAQHQTPALRRATLLVSRLGDWPAHFLAGIIGVAVAYIAGNRAWLRIFVAMIIALALAGAAARVIKVSVGRARPSVTENVGWTGPSLRSKYHSFPSGHTAASTAFFAVPCFARRRIGYAFLPIPFVIAVARILLDAHHLSDVVFAAMLGAVCAMLVWRFAARRYPLAISKT